MYIDAYYEYIESHFLLAESSVVEVRFFVLGLEQKQQNLLSMRPISGSERRFQFNYCSIRAVLNPQ